VFSERRGFQRHPFRLALTLNLALTFLPAFSGTKNIYMQAISPFASTP
jgi:hypothetical protein